MRATFVISYAVNLVFAGVSAAVLPARVATHFGVGGRADGWMSRPVYVIFLVVLHTVLFLALYLLPRLLLKVPAKWVNLPNKSYWLAPERRAQAVVKTARSMQQFGVAVFLLLLAGGVLSLKANFRNPIVLNERAFLACMALFLAYTVFWCVAFYRDFRIPAANG